VSVPTEDPQRPDRIVEVQLRHFKVMTWPRVKYFSESLIAEAFCSRSDTVKELIYKLCTSGEFE
jgi:hypothetical protein